MHSFDCSHLLNYWGTYNFFHGSPLSYNHGIIWWSLCTYDWLMWKIDINRPFHKLRPWSTLASIWKIAKVALMSLKTYNHTDLVNLTETNCKCSCSRDIICEKGFKNLLVFVTFSKVGSHSIYWGTFKSFYVKPSLELDET